MEFRFIGVVPFCFVEADPLELEEQFVEVH
jgi:hypothetical protein